MTVFVTLSIYNPTKLLQGMRNNGELTFSVGELYHAFQLVLGKTIRIGDTNYHI